MTATTRETAAGTERATIDAGLAALEARIEWMERHHGADIAAVCTEHHDDAVNLIHYLALRQTDLRPLQHLLGEYGLSSLGRCEPHVLATVRSVRAALEDLPAPAEDGSMGFDAGRGALDRNTDALFGPRPDGRVPRIMVTFPSEAADDYGLVRHLVTEGMDVARINGAHDGPDRWERMARNVRRATEETGRPCRVSMDLPGPKLRTGPLVDGPQVVRIRPRRDACGVPTVPARITLGPPVDVPGADPFGAGPPGAPAVSVDAGWASRRRAGDVVALRDTRDAPRTLHLVSAGGGTCTAEVWDTTYLETGTELDCDGDRTRVGPVPAVAQFHVLRVGDGLTLTRSLEPAVPGVPGWPAPRVGCTLPEVFDVAAPGDLVVLDDGRITGAIESVGTDELCVRVTGASPAGSKLRAGKSVNLPRTDLPVPAVTDADLPLLALASRLADMVALSFVRDRRDVDLLHEYLGRVGGDHLGVVVKIETAGGFARLPEILLRAMRSPLVGVMIARGDLAVEAGYERLAELQEEILWICEAAHLPVIWATEVLDQLARTGRPSRAEVTDAAMAQRAECVMLNKGPHVDTAIGVLDDILRRMAGHQRKKVAQLRPLRSWADVP